MSSGALLPVSLWTVSLVGHRPSFPGAAFAAFQGCTQDIGVLEKVYGKYLLWDCVSENVLYSIYMLEWLLELIFFQSLEAVFFIVFKFPVFLLANCPWSFVTALFGGIYFSILFLSHCALKLPNVPWCGSLHLLCGVLSGLLWSEHSCPLILRKFLHLKNKMYCSQNLAFSNNRLILGRGSVCNTLMSQYLDSLITDLGWRVLVDSLFLKTVKTGKNCFCWILAWYLLIRSIYKCWIGLTCKLVQQVISFLDWVFFCVDIIKFNKPLNHYWSYSWKFISGEFSNLSFFSIYITLSFCMGEWFLLHVLINTGTRAEDFLKNNVYPSSLEKNWMFLCHLVKFESSFVKPFFFALSQL